MQGANLMSEHTRRSFLMASAATASVIGMQPVAGLAQTRRMDELIEEDATGLAERLRAREFTQAELVETFIRRIEVMNPALNFMTNTAFDRARSKVDTIPLDAPFAGVPILMKDMIDIGGLPRTDGSRFMLKNVPERSVEYVEAVEAAGFNILGQTNVPEMASFIITNNDVFGATRNPWNPDYSVFSSSGGSAVAVAAGVVPMAHGTDGAGSNRLPPSATGIFGMKPSRGRMRSGEADGSHDVAKTNQMLSRTVRDSSLAFSLTESLSGDPFPPVGYIAGPSDRRLKVGLVVDEGKLIATDPEVSEAQRKVAHLMQSLGHEVEETPWPVDANEMADAYAKFFGGKVGALKQAVELASGKPLMESGLLTRFLASNIESSAAISPEDIAKGRAFLDKLVPVFADVFQKYDVLLAPVAPVVAPPLYEHSPDELFSDELSQYVAARLKFTSPINFAGCPAMSVPLSWSADLGIPIGSHFIAAEGNDRLLYELAYELEEARPWRNIWAPFSLKYVPV
jgi:amidase